MRKVVSLRGNFKVEFKDGSKEKLEPRIAQAVQDKFNRMRRADDKEAFMDKISKSKRDLLNALKESKLDEAKSATGYTLYHNSFSDAMQHAYAHAKSKMGMTVDPKEIDNKVATGPKKPSEGKTNRYSLKTNKGTLQVQVYNRGGSKPFELNMYSR